MLSMNAQKKTKTYKLKQRREKQKQPRQVELSQREDVQGKEAD